MFDDKDNIATCASESGEEDCVCVGGGGGGWGGSVGKHRRHWIEMTGLMCILYQLPHLSHFTRGPLTDTSIVRCACAWNTGNVFPTDVKGDY